jgi:hypothetical protein
MGWDNLFSKMSTYSWKTKTEDPGLPFATKSKSSLGSINSPTHWVPDAVSLSMKRAEREDASSPVPNLWNCTSTLPHVCMAWCISTRATWRFTFHLTYTTFFTQIDRIVRVARKWNYKDVSCDSGSCNIVLIQRNIATVLSYVTVNESSWKPQFKHCSNWQNKENQN